VVLVVVDHNAEQELAVVVELEVIVHQDMAQVHFKDQHKN